MASGRFRRVPPAVSLSPEWVGASPLARTVHRQVRPSAGELLLPRADASEAPWRSFQRFAAEGGADYSPAECELIVSDCVRSKLWVLRDGALVVAAFPPSFERERAGRSLGPRGGLSPAEKMRLQRAKEKVRREEERRESAPPAASVDAPAEGGVTAPSGNSDRSRDEEMPLSSSLRDPEGSPREGEETPSGNAPAAEPPPAPSVEEPTAPPARPSLGELPARDRGAEALRILGAGLGPKVGLLGATEVELEGFARLFGPRAEGAELRLERVNRFVAAASPEVLRGVFPWTSAAKQGKRVLVTPGLLLGSKKGPGGYSGSGWKALDEAATTWDAERIEAERKRAEKAAARPGPVAAAPSLAPVAAAVLGGGR